MHDTGIGDELVDPAERVDTRLDHGDHLLLVADVDPMSDAPPISARRGIGGGAVDVRAQHVAALGGEPLRDRQTDAGAGPGHDRGLAGQVWMRLARPGGCHGHVRGSPRT